MLNCTERSNVSTSIFACHRRLHVKVCLRSHLQSDELAFSHRLCLNTFTDQTQEQIHIITF